MAHSVRLHQLLLPREHGAWGMLLVPLASGLALGLLNSGAAAPALWLALALFALFLSRQPLEILLGTSLLKAQDAAQKRVLGVAVVLLWLAAAGAALAVARTSALRGLAIVGGIAVACFVAQQVLARGGRATRLLAQSAGAAALTGASAAAYVAATGRLERMAALLWAANWLFALNQIDYVHLRIQARAASGAEKLLRARGFLLRELLLVGVLLGAWVAGLAPALMLASFAPVLLRGALWVMRPAQPLRVRTVGFTELAQNIVFGALLVAALVLSPPLR